MKKMKRLLVAILGCLTALACVSGMAACKDKDSSSSSNSSSTVHTCSFEGEPEVTEATCSEAGVKTWTCTCGNTKTEAIAKAEHNLDDGIVVKAATCKETGILLISCENGCGYSKTEAIAVDETAHSWVVKSEAATCGTAGWSVEVCSACDAEKEDSYQVLEATGAHNYILDGSQSYAATCTTEGQNVYVCTTCPKSAGKGEKFIFETIEVENLHNTNLHVSLGYLIDYESPQVKNFLLKYRALYNMEPTQYAFQGYDVASYFISMCSKYGNRWVKKLDDSERQMLQSTFRMVPVEDGGYVNHGVRRVVYGPEWSVTKVR